MMQVGTNLYNNYYAYFYLLYAVRSAQNFDSIFTQNLTVLLEYIHLYQYINMVTVLLEYI